MRLSNKHRAKELKKIRDYVKIAEAEVNRLGIFPRAAYNFPFDIVGLATLSKAFAIAGACLNLLESGCPDEAYGLSRSLVECATNLRYLTASPSEQDKRSRDFAKFAKADKAFWYHHALESATTAEEKAKLHSYARQVGVTDNPKLARQHWSGQSGSFVWEATRSDHPIDGARTAGHRKKVYAVDYYLTSAFVHCSLLAIDNYCPEDEALFQISAATAHRETYRSTLFIILVHLWDAVQYVLYGLNMDGSGRLDSAYERTLKKMARTNRAKI